ncbi:MAG: NAD(P)/FAD-dependent oxidoreductase [Geminicoccaceae bacterium]
MVEKADVLILGAGIAGASLAHALADHLEVVVVERESQTGYHSTGRSAAMLIETYGSDAVQRLTRLSRPFFECPTELFSSSPLLTARGYLRIARADQQDELDLAYQAAQSAGAPIQRLDQQEVVRTGPLIAPGYAACGLFEPDAKAIDVSALHQGYLRGMARSGGRLICDAAPHEIARSRAGWRVSTSAGDIEAQVLVNAGGAWADQIAAAAKIPEIGLAPTRRTAILLDPPDAADISSWPMIADIDYRFYVKPEGQQLMVSPADQTPAPPADVQPEELDIAIAVDRYQTLTTMPVATIRHSWAGLRSFVRDGDPVVGFDPRQPGFFWLAGLGGFGIMTAPGIARLASALIMKKNLSNEHALLAQAISPTRLRA